MGGHDPSHRLPDQWLRIHRQGDASGSPNAVPSSTTTLAPLVGPNRDRAQGLLPIGPIARFTFAFAVGPGVPASVATMADYLHWLRSDSSCDNSYGAWAPGTGSHFAGLQISRHCEVPLQAVPYRGSPALLADLEAGHLPAAIVVLGTVTDSARTGKVRLLGVTSETRWPLAP